MTKPINIDFLSWFYCHTALDTVIQTKNTNGLQFSNTMSIIFNATQLINICSDTIIVNVG